MDGVTFLLLKFLPPGVPLPPYTSLTVCPVKRSLSLNGNRGSSDNGVDSSRALFFSSLSPQRSGAPLPGVLQDLVNQQGEESQGSPGRRGEGESDDKKDWVLSVPAVLPSFNFFFFFFYSFQQK